uniref:NADH:flavin oxidoreductase/NADH oxidase N-terminal domain-containing protein n=1 Tax=Globisporangium ultimum (strain ATCC 200006 / CBS 805.95 / DAOM BR144) TaxID=431595 RepID=K3WS16_GLOUD
MATAGYQLFTPLEFAKGLTLKNRVVLAPMTRCRAGEDRVANQLIERYYEQRAGAGLLITEASSVSKQAYGWHHTPALYTQEQMEGWKRVVDRVHAKNGAIFFQMWHLGRQGHPSFNEKGDLVAPSAIRLEQGTTRDAKMNSVPFEEPRALETHEIPAIVEDFRKSAVLAKQAGFDGVEIHGGNGYLVDQFLQSCTNKRTDKYGGSFENRARFLLEIVTALKTVFASDRIAVRLSPNGAYGGMGSEDNYEMFTHVFEKLSEHKLAYLAILDGQGFGFHDKGKLLTAFDAKVAFKGAVMANCSYTRDIAEGVVRSGAADLVSFGRPFISTPDLAERFENDWPLNEPASHEVFWASHLGAAGYTDFPSYSA